MLDPEEMAKQIGFVDNYVDANLRWIKSLAALLRAFGFTFEAKGHVERLPLMISTKDLVGGYSRPNRVPRVDEGMVYRVTGHDDRAIPGGESVGRILDDLTHAAECGCKGCYSRIYSQWRSYQQKIAQSQQRSNKPEDQGQ